MNFRSFILSAVALSWANVVLATPPFIETFESLDDLFIVSCDGFDVRTEAPILITEKTFFNKTGDPVRFQVSGHVTESIYYNSTDKSIFVTQRKNGVGENFFFMLDLITGEVVNAGGFFRLTLPRIGHVVMLMGVQKVDDEGNVEFHGLDAFPEGDTAVALCDALSN